MSYPTIYGFGCMPVYVPTYRVVEESDSDSDDDEATMRSKIERKIEHKAKKLAKKMMKQKEEREAKEKAKKEEEERKRKEKERENRNSVIIYDPAIGATRVSLEGLQIGQPVISPSLSGNGMMISAPIISMGMPYPIMLPTNFPMAFGFRY